MQLPGHLQYSNGECSVRSDGYLPTADVKTCAELLKQLQTSQLCLLIGTITLSACMMYLLLSASSEDERNQWFQTMTSSTDSKAPVLTAQRFCSRHISHPCIDAHPAILLQIHCPIRAGQAAISRSISSSKIFRSSG